MCGLGGAFSKRETRKDVSEILLRENFIKHLRYRGPDNLGSWFDEDYSSGAIHARLSVVDLTTRSDQPYRSKCGRYVVLFNGEIYNFEELATNIHLHGDKCSGFSEVEIITSLYKLHGAAAFSMLQGMFAIVIFDLRFERLTLARDEFGIKPLFYTVNDDVVFFSSLIKPLIESRSGDVSTNDAAAFSYYLLGFIVEPLTLFQEIFTVEPGSVLTFDKNFVSSITEFSYQSNVHLPNQANTPIAIVGAAIRYVVAKQSRADVPVALALSGGIDSAIIASCMSEHLQPRERFAITLVFEGQRGTYNYEAEAAIATAKKFGFKHKIVSYSQEDLERCFVQYLRSIDQPSFDGFNIWLVSKVAREEGFKVLLSGIGADELFNSYTILKSNFVWLNLISYLPRWMRHSLILMMRASFALRKVFGGQQPPKLAWLEQVSGSTVEIYMYLRALNSRSQATALAESDSWFVLKATIQKFLKNIEIKPTKKSIESALRVLDTKTYLRSQLLRVGDCSSMANGVEVRVPFVDQYLYEQLTDHSHMLKIDKWELARLEFDVPRMVVQRRKTGFVVPKGPIRKSSLEEIVFVFENFLATLRKK